MRRVGKGEDKVRTDKEGQEQIIVENGIKIIGGITEGPTSGRLVVIKKFV